MLLPTAQIYASLAHFRGVASRQSGKVVGELRTLNGVVVCGLVESCALIVTLALNLTFTLSPTLTPTPTLTLIISCTPSPQP